MIILLLKWYIYNIRKSWNKIKNIGGFYMLYNHFLNNRHSVREYKDKKIDNNTLIKLMEHMEEIEKDYSKNKFKFFLFENGMDLYSKLKGIGGYSGVMIESPYYIGLQVNNEDMETLLMAAYSMEALITRGYQLGLSTCWINIREIPSDIKKSLGLEDGKNMNYLLSLGYEKNKNPLQPMSESHRLSVEEIVYKDSWGENISIEELEERGLKELFYYVRYAPSNKNSQPWRFILKNDRILLGILNPERIESMIDAGIIAYYLEHMAHDTGVSGKWDIINNKPEKESGIQYQIIAQYKI